MRALITGASGYLGSKLAEHLVTAGNDVHVVLRPTSSDAQLPANVVRHTHVGTTDDALRILRFSRPTYVFHLAADQTSNPGPHDVDSLIEANVLLGTQLAHACAEVGVQAFVNTGTYWQRLGGASYRATNLYAATKQAFFDTLAYYVDARGLPAITLELPGTYGPDDRRGRILDQLVDAALTGTALKMSHGEQVMDLVHVEDVVTGFLQAADLVQEDRNVAGLTFALHSPEQPTLRDLVAIVAEVADAPVNAQLGALPYRDREMMRPSDTPQLPCWTPQVTLREGIREVIHARRAALDDARD